MLLEPIPLSLVFAVKNAKFTIADEQYTVREYPKIMLRKQAQISQSSLELLCILAETWELQKAVLILNTGGRNGGMTR